MWSVLPVLALVALAGCGGAQVRTAGFRARPDSVEAGDLRGPFDGRVVDASGQPVAGAVVYATWTFESGYGFPVPSSFREHMTSTDADGRYAIPRLDHLPRDRSVRLADFYLVVYKRGFVAYRSDRRFADLGPRFDFVQRRNRIDLKPWRGDFSHAKHIRYVGGGPVLASLTAWEAEDAAAELAGETPHTRVASELTVLPTDPSAEVVAARVMRVEDVVAITGYDGKFETGPLGDEPDTNSYSSIHLKAVDRAESFDVALRLWKVGPGEAQKRYGQLLDSLPGADETNEIADRSLRASEGDIRGVAFLDGKRGVVVLITCGASVCKTVDDAVTVAEKAYGRIGELWPVEGP